VANECLSSEDGDINVVGEVVVVEIKSFDLGNSDHNSNKFTVLRKVSTTSCVQPSSSQEYL
jgi:hypothetical protein